MNPLLEELVLGWTCHCRFLKRQLLLEVVVDCPQSDDFLFLISKASLGLLPLLLKFLDVGLLPTPTIGRRNAILCESLLLPRGGVTLGSSSLPLLDWCILVLLLNLLPSNCRDIEFDLMRSSWTRACILCMTCCHVKLTCLRIPQDTLLLLRWSRVLSSSY